MSAVRSSSAVRAAAVPGAQHSWPGRETFRFLRGLKDLALSPVLSFGVSSWENYVNVHPRVIKFADNIFNVISKE